MFLNIMLPPLILITGGFFAIKTKTFYLIHPIRTLKFTFSGKNTRSAISSLILALAGTLGVGNIAGVTLGITIGGAGSVFWLILSSFFSSAIKYAEVNLAASIGDGLGFIGVTESSFGRHGTLLSKIYSVLCLALSISMGCIIQADAIRECINPFGAKLKLFISIFFIIFTAFICKRGGARIKRAVTVILPLATLCYTVMCLFVIIPNISKFPEIFNNIITSAFCLKGFSGGVAAFIVKSGMKEGFARGLLSNEAGAGTSSFSHTALSENEAKRAGCFGIIEVFFDTLLLCPLTAFTILFASSEKSCQSIGDITDIFAQSLGAYAYPLFLFSVSAFALSTILCWYYYGEICRIYLFGAKFRNLYFILFILLFSVALYKYMETAIIFTDTLLFMLCIITMCALIKNSDRVKPPSEEELF